MAGFCTNCGSQLGDDVKFCTNCGAPITPIVQAKPLTEEQRTVQPLPVNPQPQPQPQPVYTPQPAYAPQQNYAPQQPAYTQPEPAVYMQPPYTGPVNEPVVPVQKKESKAARIIFTILFALFAAGFFGAFVFFSALKTGVGMNYAEIVTSKVDVNEIIQQTIKDATGYDLGGDYKDIIGELSGFDFDEMVDSEDLKEMEKELAELSEILEESGVSIQGLEDILSSSNPVSKELEKIEETISFQETINEKIKPVIRTINIFKYTMLGFTILFLALILVLNRKHLATGFRTNAITCMVVGVIDMLIGLGVKLISGLADLFIQIITESVSQMKYIGEIAGDIATEIVNKLSRAIVIPSLIFFGCGLIMLIVSIVLSSVEKARQKA